MAATAAVSATESRLGLAGSSVFAMAQHDAADVLPQLSCPVMVVSAGRDYLTPPRIARKMAETVRDGRYYELPQATHFGLIEQVERVNDWLLAFAKRVYLD